MAHTKTSLQLKRLLSAIALIVFCAAIGSSALSPHVAHSANGVPVTGWAWSDTIGWIDLTAGGGANGLHVDPFTGAVSGYAWSENIGWISAEKADLDAAPACPGDTSQIANNAWTGWLRAVAGIGATSGWDGCISMSGAGYGVKQDGSGGFLPCDPTNASCAWEGNSDPGAAVVGWVDFRNARYSCLDQPNYCKDDVTSCTFLNDQCLASCNYCTYGCNQLDGSCNPPLTANCNIPNPVAGGPNLCIEASPAFASSNNTGVAVTWDVSGVQGTCTVISSNGDGQPAPQPGWSTAANGSNRAQGSNTSLSVTTETVFTLTCTDLGGNTDHWTAVVKSVPVFNEF